MRIETHVRIQDEVMYGRGREDRFSAWGDCGEVRDGGKRVGYGGVGGRRARRRRRRRRKRREGGREDRREGEDEKEERKKRVRGRSMASPWSCWRSATVYEA